jgi:hypothetical protein
MVDCNFVAFVVSRQVLCCLGQVAVSGNTEPKPADTAFSLTPQLRLPRCCMNSVL